MADEIEVTLEEKVLGVSFTEQGLQVQLNESVNPIDITLDKYAVGSRGPAGKDGADGKDGATGPKGDTGPQGPEGQRGPVGDKGATGDAGLTVTVINPTVIIPADSSGAVITGGYDDIITQIQAFEGVIPLTYTAPPIGEMLAGSFHLIDYGALSGITEGAEHTPRIASSAVFGPPSAMDADYASIFYAFAVKTSEAVTSTRTVRQFFTKVRQGAPGLSSLSVYANNAAAVTGGLVAGQGYRTGGDPDLVCVVH